MFKVLTQKEAPKAKSPSPERESSKTMNNSNNQSKVSFIFLCLVGNIMDNRMDIVRDLFKVLNRLVDSTTLNL